MCRSLSSTFRAARPPTIRRAKARGLNIRAETCPQYLLLTEADLDLPDFEGAKCMCSPPPRDKASRGAVAGLAGRPVRYSVVRPRPLSLRCARQEAARHESAVPQSRKWAARTGNPRADPVFRGRDRRRIDIERFVGLNSANAAKIYGIYPRKGTISIGADADIAIWDPEKKVIIRNADLHHNVDYTPFEGMTVQGWPVTVMSRGDVVCDAGVLHGAKGRGQFIECGLPGPVKRRGNGAGDKRWT